MQKKKIMIVSVVALAVFVVGWIIVSQQSPIKEDWRGNLENILKLNKRGEEIVPPTDTERENVLVINEELEEVVFCGVPYKAKQIYINDVNVVQRIAEIASEKEVDEVCREITKTPPKTILDITIKDGGDNRSYSMHINGHLFNLNYIDTYGMFIDRPALHGFEPWGKLSD